MTPILDFLDPLLSEGRVVLRERPCIRPAERGPAGDRLREAFAIYSLDIAGPPLAFDAMAALEAAELLW